MRKSISRLGDILRRIEHTLGPLASLKTESQKSRRLVLDPETIRILLEYATIKKISSPKKKDVSEANSGAHSLEDSTLMQMSEISREYPYVSKSTILNIWTGLQISNPEYFVQLNRPYRVRVLKREYYPEFLRRLDEAK